MQPFAACFRSVGPAVDGAVAKLQTSIVAFWVATHADIWPGAVPVIDFSSDRSDVEEDEPLNAPRGRAQGKRKREDEPAGGRPAASKKKPGEKR